MENKCSSGDNKCCNSDNKCCWSSPGCALRVAGTIFGLVAFVHLYRIFDSFHVVVGSTPIPHSASIAGFIVFGLLSFWMFRSSRK